MIPFTAQNVPDLFDEEGFHGAHRFEKEFVIVSRIDNNKLTEVASSTSANQTELTESQLPQAATIVMDDGYKSKITCREQLLLCEDPVTFKRYNVRKLSFESFSDADICFHDAWRFMQIRSYKNIIQNYKVYVESKDVYIVKERYTDNLQDYLEEHRQFAKGHFQTFSEDVLITFMRNLAAAMWHLHKNGFVHALGQISTSSVFITDMYSRLLLEVGKSNQLITSTEIAYTSQELLANPFVAPEYKQLITNERFDKCINSESGDMFAIGVLFFVIMTLTDSIKELQNIFSSDEYLTRVKDKLALLNYRKELTSLVVNLLDPSPKKRYTAIKAHTLVKKASRESVKRAVVSPRDKRRSVREALTSLLKPDDLTSSTLSVPKPKHSRTRSIDKILHVFNKKERDPILTITQKTTKISDSQKEAESILIQRSKIILQGPLLRAGSRTGIMNERYYYLTDYNYLYVCKSKDTITVRSKINLNETLTVEEGTNPLVFKVKVEDKTMTLQASDEETKDLWVNALRYLLPKTPRSVPETINTKEVTANGSLLQIGVDDEVTRERLDKLASIIRLIDPQKVNIENLVDSSGQIYRVTVSEDDHSEVLAMKVLYERDLESKEFDLLLQDLKEAVSLSHVNVQSVVAVSYDQERLCLFSRFVSGGTIDSVASLNLSFDDRLDLLAQLVAGLKYIHDKQLIHGNLKSTNILLEKEGDKYTVLLADFGFTRSKARGTTQSSLSAWKYLAPEKINLTSSNNNSPAHKTADDHYSDVYSFAILSYEILTQLNAYPSAKYSIQVSNLVSRGERPKFPEISNVISSTNSIRYNRLQLIIQRCWDQEPTKRLSFADISSMVHHILESDEQTDEQ